MIKFTGKPLNDKQKEYVHKKLGKFSDMDIEINWRKNKGLHWVLTTNVVNKFEIQKIGKKFYSLITETSIDMEDKLND